MMKKKLKMKVFTIEEKVFKSKSLFVVNCSGKALQTYMKRKYKVTIEPPSENSYGTTFILTCYPGRLVWLRKYTGAPKTVGVLAHEILHLAVSICEDRGVPIHFRNGPDKYGDETAAYLVEMFTRECLKKLAK